MSTIDADCLIISESSENTSRLNPFEMLLLSIDAHKHTLETLNSMYSEGLIDLFNGENNRLYTTVKQNNDIFSIVDSYDHGLRYVKKELVMNDSSKFNQTYEYNKTRIEKETNSKGYITTYTYDNMNNITKKETKDANDQITESHEYIYDLLGRITYEKFDNIKYNYSYNQNGNIKNIDTIDEYNEIIQNIHFTYDNTIKDKLKSYTIDGTTYELTYTNEFYPTKLKGLVCEWDENKLKKVGNTTYTYNSSGQRIEKKSGYKTHTYVYDGNKLIKEEIKNPQTQVDVTLEYIYDQSDMLVAVLENNNLYYYERDLTGEIKGIVDINGNYVVKYRYKAFGEVIETNVIINNNVSTYNPFMYKGYYYDVETNLFLVSSRYYSPELCRWISPDDIEYLDPKSVNGLNLYCYCFNNPISYVDPDGHFPLLILIGTMFLTNIVDGLTTQITASVTGYTVMAFWALGDLIFNNGEGAWADMCSIKWNPFNTNETATLNSNYISFYKGVPVFRINNERSGSFGAIFLSRGWYDSAGNFYKLNDPNELRHERGHNSQLMRMGIVNYGLMIGLPSWQEWSTRSYYDRPWEITADVFGGVTGRTHSQADINRGYWYLGVSSLFGPLGYFFLIGEY